MTSGIAWRLSGGKRRPRNKLADFARLGDDNASAIRNSLKLRGNTVTHRPPSAKLGPFAMLKLLTACWLVMMGVAQASAGDARPANAWSRVSGPTAGEPQAIGGFAHGCLAGAVKLPPDGVGYEVIHLLRKRFFGHPEAVDFVERLGERAAAAGLPKVLVGDMAQPRGGPLPYGHASHQTGLDVDLWFTFAPGPRLSPAARETVALPSMLRPGWRVIDRRRFGNAQITLLRLAATDTRVDRIFVNPVIKATLCRILPAHKHTWLHRLRPWYGHDDHFHVRLECPAHSPACERQEPIPPGDGCDAILASWVRDQRPPPPPSLEPPLRARSTPSLPAEC
ncbi:MAG: penicillin-insensitive murein endopeptidase, partial [Stellaceae bacterium]